MLLKLGGQRAVIEALHNVKAVVTATGCGAFIDSARLGFAVGPNGFVIRARVGHNNPRGGVLVKLDFRGVLSCALGLDFGQGAGGKVQVQLCTAAGNFGDGDIARVQPTYV
mgnify:CR=1 FL=1